MEPYFFLYKAVIVRTFFVEKRDNKIGKGASEKLSRKNGTSFGCFNIYRIPIFRAYFAKSYSNK